MTLLLIRHGETTLNVARVLQPADTPLSDHGRAQAAALAQRLAGSRLVGAGLAGILASDLPRALATAQAIAQACGLTVATSALLQERNFGDLRGQRYDSLGFDPLNSDQAPPNGESASSFAARCALAWQAVLAAQQRLGGPLAVVTHGLVLRQWLQHGPLQLPAELMPQHGLANTSVTLASATAPYQVSLVDCTAHLDGGVGLDSHSLSGG